MLADSTRVFRRRLRKQQVLLVCLAILGASPKLPAQVTRHSPARESDALFLLDALWVGNARGLFQYRPAENVWSARSAGSGLHAGGVTRLFADEDVLWIGGERGITRYDIRSNAMIAFDSARGIPAGRVLCFAAEQDYVWAGTENGAARYDKLIEQWQTIDTRSGLAGTAVFAIAMREGRILLATDSAVCEYDPRYEKWRIYRPEIPGRIRDAFQAGPNLWLVLDEALLRFDLASNIFQSYPLTSFGGASAIRAIFIDGASFWIQTADHVHQYDTQSDGFRPFLDIDNLPDRNIQAIGYTSASDIWFATDGGLSHFVNRVSGTNRGKTWTYLTTASGVPFNSCSALYPAGQNIAAFTASEIATYRPGEQRWYTFPLPESGGETSAPFFTHDQTKGTMFQFGRGVNLSLGGSRASFLIKEPFSSDAETAKNFDLKARLELGAGRSITATYNDIDFSDIQYGVEYRGAADDVLQLAQAGDLRVEQGTRSLFQPIGIFGGGVRAAFGARTERYRRPLVEIAAAGGHQTTARTTEAFLGKNKALRRSVRAAWYLQRIFYRLDSLQRDLGVDAEPFDVFMEIGNEGGFSRNIIADTIIAGRSGNWKRLDPLNDYVLDAARGIVSFRVDVGLQAIVARSVINGRVREVLLNDTSRTPHEMLNVYALGVSNIIPSSLRCSDWMLEPEYGLDRDRDGLIDAEHVDYTSGYLRFPAARPFPPDTYTDTARFGRLMSFGFQTTSASYSLAHPRVMRGSEAVMVDGVLTRAGEDYVLDYTSGSLSFTRDGVALDDSRIEVTYEYVANDAERQYGQASVTVSPSDLLQGSVTGAAFTTGPSNVPTSVVHAMLDGRMQTGGLDLRIAPEFSRSHTAWDTPNTPPADGNAMALALAASYGPARLNASARRRDEGYVGVFKRWYAFGDLHNSASVQAELDLTSTLRLFGNWRARGGSEEFDPNERQLDAGVKWFDPAYPSITVRFTHGNEDDPFLPLAGQYTRFGAGRRDALRADAQYVLPAEVLTAVGLVNASIASYFRYGSEENPSVPYTAWTSLPASFRFLNSYLRLAVAPRPMFTFTAYYRGDEQRASRSTGGVWTRVQSNERLFVDGVMEHITGVSLSGRYTNDIRMYGLSAGTERDNTDDNRALQFGARFSPGIALSMLRDVTLEINARSDSRRIVEDAATRPLVASLFTRASGTDRGHSGSLYLESKIEWRPLPGLLSVTTGRFTENRNQSGASAALDTRRDLVQRVDIHGSGAALYTLQASYMEGRNPWSDFCRFAPFLFTEHRLSALLLGRLTVSAAHELRHQGADLVRNSEIAPGASLTLSLQRVGVLPRTELRYDLGLQYSEMENDPGSDGFRPSLFITRAMSHAVSLDVYPFGASYIRFMVSHQQSRLSPSGMVMKYTSSMLQAVVQL